MANAMCRICLADNIRMRPIVNTDLQDVYEKLTENMLIKDGRPLQACYICYTRLKHSHELRQKCHLAEEMLTQMLNGSRVDRRLIDNFKSLRTSPTDQYSTSSDSEVFVKVEPSYDLEMVTMKPEIIKESSPELDTCFVATKYESFSDSDDNISLALTEIKKSNKKGKKRGRKPKKDKVKKEMAVAKKLKSEPEPKAANPDEKPFQCHICHKSFRQKGNMQRHILIHTGERPFKCDQCSMSFGDKSTLTKHFRRHTGERPYICDMCPCRFSLMQSLKTHIRIHTGEKPYKCHICHNSFSRKNNLKSHIRIHTGEKLYKCDVCEKSFVQKSHLKKHASVHSDEKPFKCFICQSNFSLKSYLKNHIRIRHTTEKQYKCEICQKSFIQECHLKRHSRIHTDEKPFKCHLCQSCFRDKDKLNTHIHIHTGEKPYKCEYCQKCFSRSDYLKNHYRTHVGKQEMHNNIDDSNVLPAPVSLAVKEMNSNESNMMSTSSSLLGKDYENKL